MGDKGKLLELKQILKNEIKKTTSNIEKLKKQLVNSNLSDEAREKIRNYIGKCNAILQNVKEQYERENGTIISDKSSTSLYFHKQFNGKQMVLKMKTEVLKKYKVKEASEKSFVGSRNMADVKPALEVHGLPFFLQHNASITNISCTRSIRSFSSSKDNFMFLNKMLNYLRNIEDLNRSKTDEKVKQFSSAASSDTRICNAFYTNNYMMMPVEKCHNEFSYERTLGENHLQNHERERAGYNSYEESGDEYQKNKGQNNFDRRNQKVCDNCNQGHERVFGRPVNHCNYMNDNMFDRYILMNQNNCRPIDKEMVNNPMNQMFDDSNSVTLRVFNRCNLENHYIPMNLENQKFDNCNSVNQKKFGHLVNSMNCNRPQSVNCNPPQPMNCNQENHINFGKYNQINQSKIDHFNPTNSKAFNHCNPFNQNNIDSCNRGIFDYYNQENPCQRNLINQQKMNHCHPINPKPFVQVNSINPKAMNNPVNQNMHEYSNPLKQFDHPMKQNLPVTPKMFGDCNPEYQMNVPNVFQIPEITKIINPCNALNEIKPPLIYQCYPALINCDPYGQNTDPPKNNKHTMNCCDQNVKDLRNQNCDNYLTNCDWEHFNSYNQNNHQYVDSQKMCVPQNTVNENVHKVVYNYDSENNDDNANRPGKKFNESGNSKQIADNRDCDTIPVRDNNTKNKKIPKKINNQDLNYKKNRNQNKVLKDPCDSKMDYYCNIGNDNMRYHNQNNQKLVNNKNFDYNCNMNKTNCCNSNYSSDEIDYCTSCIPNKMKNVTNNVDCYNIIHDISIDSTDTRTSSDNKYDRKNVQNPKSVPLEQNLKEQNSQEPPDAEPKKKSNKRKFFSWGRKKGTKNVEDEKKVSFTDNDSAKRMSAGYSDKKKSKMNNKCEEQNFNFNPNLELDRCDSSRLSCCANYPYAPSLDSLPLTVPLCSFAAYRHKDLIKFPYKPVEVPDCVKPSCAILCRDVLREGVCLDKSNYCTGSIKIKNFLQKMEKKVQRNLRRCSPPICQLILGEYRHTCKCGKNKKIQLTVCEDPKDCFVTKPERYDYEVEVDDCCGDCYCPKPKRNWFGRQRSGNESKLKKNKTCQYCQANILGQSIPGFDKVNKKIFDESIQGGNQYEDDVKTASSITDTNLRGGNDNHNNNNFFWMSSARSDATNSASECYFTDDDLDTKQPDHNENRSAARKSSEGDFKSNVRNKYSEDNISRSCSEPVLSELSINRRNYIDEQASSKTSFDYSNYKNNYYNNQPQTSKFDSGNTINNVVHQVKKGTKNVINELNQVSKSCLNPCIFNNSNVTIENVCNKKGKKTCYLKISGLPNVGSDKLVWAKTKVHSNPDGTQIYEIKRLLDKPPKNINCTNK